jgi:hypothetical protein
LLKPWLYLGALLALEMITPNLLWQYHHGWPFLELANAGAHGKNIVLSPLALLGQHILLIGPAAAPVCIAGLWAFAVRPKLAVYRAFVIAWFTLLVLVLLLHGKAYYATPIYPTLLAGGAVWIESRLRSMVARTAVTGVVTGITVFILPFAIPVLPINAYIAYSQFFGSPQSTTATEHLKMGPLPQYFADMFGWPEMAAKVATIYNQLPPADRARAVFLGGNYGEAAAIDVFGQPLGLPPAICGHNNYFLWGPRAHDGSVVIKLGGKRTALLQRYQEVTVVGYIDNPYAMPYETNLPIYVLRGRKIPLDRDWLSFKNYN